MYLYVKKATMTSGNQHTKAPSSKRLSSRASRPSKVSKSKAEPSTKRRPRKQGSMSRSRKILIGLGFGASATLIVGAGLFGLFLGQIEAIVRPKDDPDFNLNQIHESLVQPENPDDPFYVLVVGSDARPEQSGGRSDTIILCRIDPRIPSVTMLSIPRDTKVQIEGYGTQKINAAFAFNGQAGVIQAVSELCGVDIAHYCEFRFEGVVDLVDNLGGVEVNVPVYVYYDGVALQPGTQTLYGREALVFARCRNFPMSDYQRMIDQRILMQAVLKKVLDMKIYELPGRAQDLANCMKTDLSVTDGLALLLKLKDIDNKNIYMETVPSAFAYDYENEISYVAVDREALAIMIDRINQGLSPKEDG